MDQEDLGVQLQCPVCLEIPPGKIVQCRNGHTVCDLCSSTISECPICRVKYGKEKIRNRQMEFLLDAMTFPCSNGAQGCEEKLKRKDIPKHVLACSSAAIQLCELLGLGNASSSCSFTVSRQNVQQFMLHLEKEHDGISVNNPGTGRIKVHFENFKEVVSNVGREASVWKPVLIKKYPSTVFLLLAFLHGMDNSASWACLSLSHLEGGEENHAHFRIRGVGSKAPELKWTQKALDFVEARSHLPFLVPFRIPFVLLDKHLEQGDSNAKLTVEVSIQSKRKEDGEVVTEASVSSSTRLMKQVEEEEEATEALEEDEEDWEDLEEDESRVVFPEVSCDNCGLEPITSVRYKCLQCADFDLCATCKAQRVHSLHTFAVIESFRGSRFVDKLMRTPSAPPFQVASSCSSASALSSVPRTQMSFPRSECNNCHVSPITKLLYMCLQCNDFDMCESCIRQKYHSHHVFAMIQSEEQLNLVRRAGRDSTGKRKAVIGTVASSLSVLFHTVLDGVKEGFKEEGGSGGRRSHHHNRRQQPTHSPFDDATCKSCGRRRLRGTRFRCLQCANADFCLKCINSGRHSLHALALVKSAEHLQILSLQPSFPLH